MGKNLELLNPTQKYSWNYGKICNLSIFYKKLGRMKRLVFTLEINITPLNMNSPAVIPFKELLFINHNINLLLDCSQWELFPKSHAILSITFLVSVLPLCSFNSLRIVTHYPKPISWRIWSISVGSAIYILLSHYSHTEQIILFEFIKLTLLIKLKTSMIPLLLIK
jgi:hypothetical protein